MDNLQERIEEACNILNGAKNPMTAMVGANGGKQLMEVKQLIRDMQERIRELEDGIQQRNVTIDIAWDNIAYLNEENAKLRDEIKE